MYSLWREKLYLGDSIKWAPALKSVIRSLIFTMKKHTHIYIYASALEIITLFSLCVLLTIPLVEYKAFISLTHCYSLQTLQINS